MQKFIKDRLVLIVGIIFVLVLTIIIVVIFKFGLAYKGGLENLSDSSQNKNEFELSKKKPVKKITFKNQDDGGCIEVTPEGIVRVYIDCNKELGSAARLNDPSNILKLIKLVSETDWEKYKKKISGGYYEIDIETESGITTIYLPDGGSGNTDEIEKIIDDIKKDIPNESPLPTNIPASLSPYVSSWPSILPSGETIFMSPGPSPSGIIINPFICPFAESGGKKKPVNVSNIICSNDPSPAP
jgi:hypothetical protein